MNNKKQISKYYSLHLKYQTYSQLSEMQRGSSVCNKALLKMGEVLLTVDVWEKKHDHLKTKIQTVTIKGLKRWQTKQLWFANHITKGMVLGWNICWHKPYFQTKSVSPTFPILTVSECSKTWASCSQVGAKALQWPHQGAKNLMKWLPFKLKRKKKEKNI